jgi:hypothetical protein
MGISLPGVLLFGILTSSQKAYFTVTVAFLDHID